VREEGSGGSADGRRSRVFARDDNKESGVILRRGRRSRIALRLSGMTVYY